jgi:transposase
MLCIAEGRCIWLWTSPTDMRRSFDGLSAQVHRHLEEDPSSGHWFVFINRRRTQLKILAFEEGGYCLWSKWLEQGPFALLGEAGEAKRSLSRTVLLALFEGIDMVVKKQLRRYK